MITLQFDDLDQLAETIWALLAQQLFHIEGSDAKVSAAMWSRLPEEGKQAARAIAAQIAEIWAAKQ